MLFTVFQWIWLILIVVGVVLLVARPVFLLKNKATALTDRTKSLLWFFQALGFWALVIGSWMRLESIVQSVFEPDEDADEASDDDNVGKKR